MAKKPENKKEFMDLFGDGFKYPIKLDKEQAWILYSELTAKQKDSFFRIRESKLTALSEKSINDLIVNVCKIDKTHLDKILLDLNGKVKFLDSIKETKKYNDLFTSKIKDKLALNVSGKESIKDQELVIDTGSIGDLIKENCTLKLP